MTLSGLLLVSFLVRPEGPTCRGGVTPRAAAVEDGRRPPPEAALKANIVKCCRNSTISALVRAQTKGSVRRKKPDATIGDPRVQRVLCGVPFHASLCARPFG
jgi:hypothetical protein